MAPAFETLYLAENPMVALSEARGAIWLPSDPRVVVPHPKSSAGDFADPGESRRLPTVTDPAKKRGTTCRTNP